MPSRLSVHDQVRADQAWAQAGAGRALLWKRVPRIGLTPQPSHSTVECTCAGPPCTGPPCAPASAPPAAPLPRAYSCGKLCSKPPRWQRASAGRLFCRLRSRESSVPARGGARAFAWGSRGTRAHMLQLGPLGMARPEFQAACSHALQESADCRARHASLRARPTQKWQVAGPGGRPGRRADKVDDARAQAELAQQRGGLGGADPGVRALHGAAQLVAAVGVHAAAPRALQPRLQPGYVRHEARAAKQLLAHALPRRAPRLVPGRAARTLGCPEGTRHTCPRLAGCREMQSFSSRR